MDATLPFRWRRSPSHGKCSRRFCGSLRNYGRSHHQHQRETLDGHALKSNRREECVLMPAKMSRSAPRPPFRLREVSIAVRTLRLSCRKAGKAQIFTPVREPSGESRLNSVEEIFRTVGQRLGRRLKRSPDGEIGGRRVWVLLGYTLFGATPFLCSSPRR